MRNVLDKWIVWQVPAAMLVIGALAGIGLVTYGAVDIYVKNVSIADKIEALKKAKLSLEEDIDRLNSLHSKANANLKRTTEEYTALFGKLSAANIQLSERQKSVADLDFKLQQAKTEHAALADENQKLSSEVAALTQTRSVLNREIEQFTNQRESLRPFGLRYQTLTQDIRSAETRQIVVRKQLENLHSNINNLQTRYDKLQEEFLTQKGSLTSVRNDLAAAQETLRATTTQKTALEKQVSALEKNRQDLESKIALLVQNLKSYEASIADATARLTRAQNSRQTLDNFRSYIQELSVLVEKYTVSSNALDTTLNAIRSQEKVLSDASKATVKTGEQLRLNTQSIQSAAMGLTKEIQAIHSARKNIDESAKHLSNSTQLDEFNARLLEMSNLAAKYRSEAEALENTVNALKVQQASLSETSTVVQTAGKNLANEVQNLQELNRHAAQVAKELTTKPSHDQSNK